MLQMPKIAVCEQNQIKIPVQQSWHLGRGKDRGREGEKGEKEEKEGRKGRGREGAKQREEWNWSIEQRGVF